MKIMKTLDKVLWLFLALCILLYAGNGVTVVFDKTWVQICVGGFFGVCMGVMLGDRIKAIDKSYLNKEK